VTARPPYCHPFDLASLGDAEKVIEFAPSVAERGAIAAWAGIDALSALSATVRLRRAGTDAFEYSGTFSAEIAQSCVVTLDPVHTRIEGTVERKFQATASLRKRHAQDEEPLEADDETEPIIGGILDLAAPVLEELALAIDPYPRAPGAVFEAPSDSDKPANPFAVLAGLKKKG
jgi:uncharacterized metal-binding protein YceD (DUF177 family)